MSKTTGLVLDILIQAGIDHVFGMPGGAAIFLYDALVDRQDKLRTVLARQEGAAACMADMYGRLTRKPGVVIAQGAWAGSNAAFGVIEAYLAGSPMLIFADISDYAGLNQHAPYQCMGGDYGSGDLAGIFRSITKYTTVANTPDEFVHGTALAVKHATTGRPGPAAVLFRWNVAMSDVDPARINPRLYPLEGYLRVSPPAISREDAEKAAEALLKARAPVMILGRGVHASGAYDEVRELAEAIALPVATTYMGKSAIPETHELALGIIGQIGQEAANRRVMEADLLLAVGTCLGPENTKMLSPEFIRPDRQAIIQIDTEPLNIGWARPVAQGITADAKSALASILAAIRDKAPRIEREARLRELEGFKTSSRFFACESFSSESDPVLPERIIGALNAVVGPKDLVTLDCGNSRMFAAKLFQSKAAGQVVAPGGAAGVGWGIPAALGAQLVRPDRRVVCVCGDGGMFMMLHCLETARQYRLPVTYVVLNNAGLCNVLDFQAPGRRIATEYDEPDFAAIARTMGCSGAKVRKPSELEPALEAALSSDRPTVVDVATAKQPHFVLMS
ncbi:MAG: thiamine pyrophosphate-binding protein [bacterium]